MKMPTTAGDGCPSGCKILAFGGGGLALALARRFERCTITRRVICLPRDIVDVRDAAQVRHAVEAYAPDRVINCAGVSDMLPDISLQEVIDTNLTGAINVGGAAAALGIPCILVASTAGMQYPAQHPWYGPAKAGVIAYVAAAGKRGHRIWALSPNRMDTSMRQHDWPDEDLKTRLNPYLDVVPVILDIFGGMYAPGANVVVRKVGLTRVDTYEEASWTLPSLLD